ncbi:MAG TPA: hypothetical protein VK157_07670 [Phycisphaerales bacterium]|nr:hypothetical protein [Phycisphaerales bacterium]
MAKRAVVRRVVKWGGLVVSVLSAVAWVGSCWGIAQWMSEGVGVIRVHAGLLTLHESDWSPMWGGMSGLTVDRSEAEMQWWFVIEQAPDISNYSMPLWVPLLIAAGATAAAWRADVRERRRQRVGSCPACGYDRRGLDAGKVCPECGAASHGESVVKPGA